MNAEKYLTKDNYVADALVTILQGQSPEKFQKIFSMKIIKITY